jgi:hypothetical protein
MFYIIYPFVACLLILPRKIANVYVIHAWDSTHIWTRPFFSILFLEM